METDEQSEFLPSTDEEDSSEEDDDDCLHLNKTSIKTTKLEKHVIFNKLEYYMTTFALILSSTSLIILLPVYLEVLNKRSNVYVMMQFTSLCSVLIFIGIILIVKKFSLRYASVSFYVPPIGIRDVLKLSSMYTLAGFMVVYSMDQKRVVCHIQDPVKGLVLVFSLVYYFLFCNQLMKLQSIFSTTAIIVGLFVSIDYGLCNKFRCRGQDYNQSTDDGGSWIWQAHTLWTVLYIVGLALFSGFYVLLEKCLVPVHKNSAVGRSSLLLTTISCLVSSRDAISARNRVISEAMPIIDLPLKRKPPSCLHLAVWIHFFVWIFTTSLFWITFLPTFKKVFNEEERFWNASKADILCNFAAVNSYNNDCGNLTFYSWMLLLSFVGYSISSLKFLIISQSAVFVSAITIVSLPLSFVWWSMFRLDASTNQSVLTFSPILTGELICALLGLPIILTGLIFLNKWHFYNQSELDQVVDSLQEAYS